MVPLKSLGSTNTKSLQLILSSVFPFGTRAVHVGRPFHPSGFLACLSSATGSMISSDAALVLLPPSLVTPYNSFLLGIFAARGRPPSPGLPLRVVGEKVHDQFPALTGYSARHNLSGGEAFGYFHCEQELALLLLGTPQQSPHNVHLHQRVLLQLLLLSHDSTC